MAIGGDVIPLKLTRKLWLIDLKLDQQAFGHFIHKDPETNMSPIEMIFQHRCATAMLILLYGEFGKTNVIAHGFYELFLLSMRADYAVLDEHLFEIMYPYDEELFTQKKLHEVIPRFVKFYKDILRAKDQTGTSLIALFDTFKTSILADYHTLAEFFKLNVRLALVMVKMESLEFDYEFFELVLSMPGYPVFSSLESKDIFQTLLTEFIEFNVKTDEEQEIIFKLLPLFRLNLNFINDEDIDPETLDSILRLNPKISFRILKFLGISHKFYSGRIAKTLRFHFHKLKERLIQKYKDHLVYYWYESAVKRLHDFMKQEFNDQRWLEFMQDLRQDQLNDKKVHVTMVDYAESVFGVRNGKNSVYVI